MKSSKFGLRNIMHLRRACLGLVFISLIVMGLPLSVLVHFALAQPTILTWKWTSGPLGSNYEGGLVIGDVTGDGIEDVVYAGCSYDTVYVLNGTNGDTIAEYYNSRLGAPGFSYSQPQLYDVDGDGTLDILVPLFYVPGLAAVRYNQVTGNLDEMWEVDVQGPPTGSGSVMAKPVAGDIDNDGHLDIFLASQDVSPGNNMSGNYSPNGYDGTVVRLDYQGNEVARTFTWRACSGGLSLADTDNDGVFELYQGDRQAMSSPSRSGYSDGGYGKGVRSFWADNLTERWNRLDFLSSSQSPVLVDVNGDGILDVLAGMYNEMNILNSSNGEMIQRWSTGRNDPISMSVHYGFTVYDIDDDGHLELFCSDGDHDDDPYVDVFDLVTGEFDAQLSLAGGDWKWGPTIADISPTHPGKEIIMAANGTTLEPNYWNGAIMVYSSNYESLQNITRTTPSTRLRSQLSYPFVQDIDNDGLLELVLCSSDGYVYAFDTPGPAPTGSERIRSDVTYFGERRLGVAEHTILPWENDYWTAPLVAPISPGDNALAVPVSTSQLSFKLREHQSESLTYNVTTFPKIGSDDGSISSGTYDWNVINVGVGGLVHDTTYQWTITADDGTEVTSRTYTFRTEHAPNPSNHAPTQSTPLLVSQDGLDTSTSIFVCSNQSTDDLDGDEVTNIYRWLVNGDPVAQVLLPFDTRNETLTKDYSGYGNDGVVKGAVWVPDGTMGGAYMFDGKDDAIIISDGGLGYFNDQNYPDNNEELGGFGNWNEITVEAWIYLTEYNNGSKIVAKVPSYALGFYSGYTSRLYAAVWPYTGYVDPDNDNQNAEDREQTVSADVDIDLNTWYHIAFTYENGVGLRLYFNGELVAERSTREGPLSRSRGEPLYIGRLVQPFAGMIDDVRIYSYAQPEEQIYNRYMESKDGNSSSSLFYPVGIAGIGDSLACEVIPTDSFEEGDTEASDPIILLNSPPVASSLQIYPVRARDFRLDDEDLDASYEYYDADGHVEGASEIRWYRDGSPMPAFNDLTHIPAGSTSVGDEWNFTVRPQDSWGDFGDLQTSYTVTIYENTPPSTGTPQLDSSEGTDFDDEDLIATALGTFDSDGNPVTNIYHWILEGTYLTNLQMPFDTETPLYLNSNATAKDYSGYGNDGTVVGAQWVEDGVVGGGYYFDGSDYIRVEESGSSLGGDGSWTEISVEFWVKAPAGTTSTEHVIFKHDLNFSTGGWGGQLPYGVGYMVDFRARGSRNEFTWYILKSDGNPNSTAYTLYDDPLGWHHVVCTYKSGVGLTIYIDGLQRASLLNASIIGSVNATLDGILDIGGYASGGTDFSGTLDEIRVYPRALSSAQVFQRFIETKDGLSDSSTIVAQETTAGDDWVCEVIPNDSWDDGTSSASSSLHVSAVVGNSRPRIDWYSPVDTTPEVDEGGSIDFAQISSDPDGNPLTYSWLLDGDAKAATQDWTYSPGFGEAGIHNVTLIVDDGELFDAQEWSVSVADVSSPEDVYLVVRGLDDMVYYRFYNSSSDSWGDWGVVPSGATLDSPAAAVFSGKLHIVVRGLDGYSLWFGSINLTDQNFTGWAGLSGATESAPTLVSYEDGLVLVVRGLDNAIYYRFYNGASEVWEEWAVVPSGSTIDSPAAAVADGVLHIAVRGIDGYSLWHGSVNMTTSEFSGWTALSGATDSKPTLAWSESRSELLLVVRGLDNVVYYNEWSGVSWGGWTALSSGATCDGPAATVIGEEVQIVVLGMDGNSLWHCDVNLSTQDQSGWTALSGATPSAPTLTT